MKKILEVFQTYCDAYLEYLNNFITAEAFESFYNLDPNEVNSLLVAARATRSEGGSYREIDWSMNRTTNTKYTEKNIHH
jgi:hypothetical protein